VVTRWLRRNGVGGIRLTATLPRWFVTMAKSTLPADRPARFDHAAGDGRPAGRIVSGAVAFALQPRSAAGRHARCRTGVHRMRAALPSEAMVGHKTGTLSNTSSDVGIIRSNDGRTIAVAIYVTGQGGRPGRDQRIATITRAIYDGYQAEAKSDLAMMGGSR
jgi:beta-lactamase class A